MNDFWQELADKGYGLKLAKCFSLQNVPNKWGWCGWDPEGRGSKPWTIQVTFDPGMPQQQNYKQAYT